jgi:hypothetical protein
MVFSGCFYLILHHDGLASVAIYIGHHPGYRGYRNFYSGL